MAEKKTTAELRAELEIKKQLAETQEELNQVTLETLELNLRASKENKDTAQTVFRHAEALKRFKEETEGLKAAQDQLRSGTEGLIKTLTGVTKSSDGVIGGFAEMRKQGKSFSESLSVMADELKETMTATNLMASTTKKFIEASFHPTRGLTAMLDNATAGFAKASGTGSKYKDVIRAAEHRNRKYGISADQAAKSTGALLEGFTEFLMMSEDAQANLATTVSSFEAIGVESGNTVRFLQAVTRTTGRTSEQALQLQSSLMATASAFGDNLNAVMAEAAEVLPRIAIHGSNTEDVLDNLYSTSKRTGFAMGDIVSMSEQFDTFDSAADAAGNLNAVLMSMGGAPMLDTMAILEETDPAKRMQLFADAVEGSVGNFEQLGYYQQKAIANSMGLSVEETRRLMLQEEQTSSLDEAMKRQNLSQDEYNELAKESRSLMDELKIMAMKFAVALKGPINALKTIVGLITKGLDGIDKVMGKVGLGKVSGLVKLGLGVGIAKVVAMGISKLTGGGLFGPTGSITRPFHVIIQKGGAMMGMFSKLKNRLMGRFGVPGGRIGPALPPGMGGGGGGGGFFAPGMTRRMGHNLTGGAFRRGAGLTKGMRLAKFAKSGLGVGLLAGAGSYGINKLTEGTDYERAGDIAGGALSGAATGAMLGSVVPVVGTGLGAAIGAGIGGLKSAFFANGGIVSGPTLSVLGESKQNPTEAVIPLPDGRSVPVDMSGQGELTEKLDQILRAIQNSSVKVLVKSDLEAAGFANMNRVVVR
jgi:hypothetical protein